MHLQQDIIDDPARLFLVLFCYKVTNNGCHVLFTIKTQQESTGNSAFRLWPTPANTFPFATKIENCEDMDVSMATYKKYGTDIARALRDNLRLAV